MTDNAAKAELERENHQVWDDLEGIVKEHLPPELEARAIQLMDRLCGNIYSQGFEDLRVLYLALAALLPDHVAQIRAAFAATVFQHDRNDEWDWAHFEGRQDLMDLLRPGGFREAGP